MKFQEKNKHYKKSNFHHFLNDFLLVFSLSSDKMTPIEQFDWPMHRLKKLFHNILSLNIFDEKVRISPIFVILLCCFVTAVFGYFRMIVQGVAKDQFFVAVALLLSYVQVRITKITRMPSKLFSRLLSAR